MHTRTMLHLLHVETTLDGFPESNALADETFLCLMRNRINVLMFELICSCTSQWNVESLCVVLHPSLEFSERNI